MNDTSEEPDAISRAAVLRIAPVDRMRQALIYSDTIRDLSLNRLRARYPDKATIELVELLLDQRLIPDIARVRGA